MQSEMHVKEGSEFVSMAVTIFFYISSIFRQEKFTCLICSLRNKEIKR